MEINNNNLKNINNKSQNPPSFISKITFLDKKYSEIIHKTEVNIITEFLLFIYKKNIFIYIYINIYTN